MIKLNLLGRPVLEAEDAAAAEAVLSQPKRLAILFCLAVARDPHYMRRDTLLTMFWPDSGEEQARGSLRQSLSFLRRQLGEDVILTRGNDEIGLNPDRVQTDLAAFIQHLVKDRRPEALALYRGEFLEGFTLGGCPGFDDWMSAQRRQYRELAVIAAHGHALDLQSEERYRDAVAWARKATEIHPDDEDTVQFLIISYSRAGNRYGAIRVYEAFEARMREEYATRPSPETVSLIRAIAADYSIDGDDFDDDPDFNRDNDPDDEPDNGPGGDHIDDRAAADDDPDDGSDDDPGHLPEPPLGGTTAKPGGFSESLLRAGWLFPVVAVLLAASLVLLYLVNRPAPADDDPATDSRRIVVVPFENHTGDPSLDPVGLMAADWVTQGLSRADFLEVVPVMTMMAGSRSRDVPPGGDAAMDLALETGSGTLVTGAYYLEGGRIHLVSRILQVPGGRMLRPQVTVSSQADAPLEAVNELRNRLLAEIAPLLDPRGTHTRVAAVPPSYESYLAYMDGLRAFTDRDYRRCVEHQERALAIDDGYPMASLVLAICNINLGNWAEADRISRKLDQERGHMGRFEEVTLDQLRAWIRGDLNGAWQAARKVAMMAPGSIPEYSYGQESRRTNRLELAAEILSGMDPDRGEIRDFLPYWVELADVMHMLGRREEEMAAAREAVRRHPGNGTALYMLARAYVANGDAEAAMRITRQVTRTRLEGVVLPGSFIFGIGREMEVHGMPDLAREQWQAAFDWYEEERGRGTLSLTGRFNHLVALIYTGHLDQARVRLSEVSAMAGDDLRVDALGGIIAALQNRPDDYRIHYDRLSRRDEPFTFGTPQYWLAVMAAAAGDETLALRHFRDAKNTGYPFNAEMHVSLLSKFLGHNAEYREMTAPG